jgi:hypothetical protein
MNENLLIQIFICHNIEIVNNILNDPKKDNFHILFVGKLEISDELSNNKRITIAKNLPNNIENEKDLLTFTAWYAIAKNNLFSEYKYICILEYDVLLKDNFELELINNCKLDQYDIIPFIKATYFYDDINRKLYNYFINKKGIEFKVIYGWYATTNYCLKRTILLEFVDFYYPDCTELKKLHPSKISWYHERIFYTFIDSKLYNIFHLDLLSHDFSLSHSYMHKEFDIPINLIDHYISNQDCNFLKKLIDNYDFFLKLNIDFQINVGSYLCNGNCYSYTNKIYEKQKLLFESAKNYKNALLIGNYMGHIAFIMLMANHNINITCIDNESNYKYVSLLEEYFNININFFISDNQDSTFNILPTIIHDFDFIHISQQYPIREYLNMYIDICIDKTKLYNLTFILDDYNVYNDEIIKKIEINNIHCKLYNKIIVNGSNTTIKFDMNINKKYLLIYNDESGKYYEYINKLKESVEKYDKTFEIIIFSKKDIDNNFLIENKYILDQNRGGGYWLWKPYIINETLKNINENDILFYIDSKYYFTEKFSELYKSLFNEDFLIWRNKPNEESYYLKNWCKMDVIHKYNVYEEVFEKNMEACWAGAMIMRKTNNVINIIQEWLTMCCSENITDIPSIIQNSIEFNDHRHDQTLLSIVLWKYKIPLYTFEKKFLQNVRRPY